MGMFTLPVHPSVVQDRMLYIKYGSVERYVEVVDKCIPRDFTKCQIRNPREFERLETSWSRAQLAQLGLSARGQTGWERAYHHHRRRKPAK